MEIGFHVLLEIVIAIIGMRPAGFLGMGMDVDGADLGEINHGQAPYQAAGPPDLLRPHGLFSRDAAIGAVPDR